MKKIIFLFLFLLITSNCYAVTYFVDNSTTSCSSGDTDYDPETETCGAGESTVYFTPQEAANVVSAGDTVIFKANTYQDFTTGATTRTLRMVTSGTVNNWITFKSETKWGAIFDGNNDTIDYGISFESNMSYIRIEGLDITDYGVGGIHMNQPNISNIYIYGCHVHHIANIASDYSGLDGIDDDAGTAPNYTDRTSYVTVDSCVINNVGKSSGDQEPGEYNHDHGCYTKGDHWTIINNIFYLNRSGWDIALSDKGGDQDRHHYIVNNTIIADNYDANKWGGILIRVSSVWIDNNIITVPTAWASTNGAISIYSTGTCEDETYFKNNLTNSDSIWAERDGSRNHSCDDWPILLNNIESADETTIFTGLSSDVDGLIPSDTDTDYQQKVGSPTLDAGVEPSIPTIPGGLIWDYYNTAIRPQNSIWDIGAWEEDSSSGPFPIPEDGIIDNDDEPAWITETGTWILSGGADPCCQIGEAPGPTSVYANDAATFTFSATIDTEEKQLYAWHTWKPSRCTNVSIKVYDDNSLLEDVTVNQQNNAAEWNLLGTYTFDSEIVNVKIDVPASPGCSVSADAVKFVNSPPPEEDPPDEGHTETITIEVTGTDFLINIVEPE